MPTGRSQAETIGATLYTWWELVYSAPGEATPQFTAQFLSDGLPMRAGIDPPQNIERYVYHEAGLPAVEYIDADSGDPVLPFMEGYKSPGGDIVLPVDRIDIDKSAGHRDVPDDTCEYCGGDSA